VISEEYLSSVDYVKILNEGIIENDATNSLRQGGARIVMMQQGCQHKLLVNGKAAGESVFVGEFLKAISAKVTYFVYKNGGRGERHCTEWLGIKSGASMA
jgi:hypothetical protein